MDCLTRLYHQEFPDGINMNVTLVDDGSSDGTAEAISKQFPDTEIISGDGNLYWCGGMRLAWRQAAKKNPDYYLLLNDDTHLRNGAIFELLDICGSPDSTTIAVASIMDPDTGMISYGGIKRGAGLQNPAGKHMSCDTFNANCVLITRAIYEKMGVLHHAYTHAMGDTDYGLQASRQGVDIIASGHFLGDCRLNKRKDVWRDRSLTRIQRFKALQSPKGLPFKEWLIYNWRNSGWLWPYYTVSPILRIILGR